MYNRAYYFLLLIGELLSVKAHITALASTADKDDIIAHFSSVCDKTVEIASPIKLGGGKAEVVLKGISVEGNYGVLHSV